MSGRGLERFEVQARSRAGAGVAVSVMLTALLATACAHPVYSSHYRVKDSRRISVVKHGNRDLFVREGIYHRSLRKAVAGNPKAERAAQMYEHFSRRGAQLKWAGLGCAAVGFVAMSTVRMWATDGTDYAGIPISAAMFGSMAFFIMGERMRVRSAPLFLDAINIFNDSVDPNAREPTARSRLLMSPPTAPPRPKPLVRCDDLDADPGTRARLRQRCARDVSVWQLELNAKRKAQIYEALPRECRLLIECSRMRAGEGGSPL